MAITSSVHLALAHERRLHFSGACHGSGLNADLHEFTEKPRAERIAAFVGFACMAIGGVGAILVGAFPENR